MFTTNFFTTLETPTSEINSGNRRVVTTLEIYICDIYLYESVLELPQHVIRRLQTELKVEEKVQPSLWSQATDPQVCADSTRA